MFISLLALGLVLTAAGFVTIGFGIPINAFSLGNTLIIAGTIAATGGFILIGLAAAVRQLKRIAEAVRSGPRPARLPEASESMVPPTARMTPMAPAAAPGRTPAPPKASDIGMPRPPEPRPAPELRAPEPRLVEPRFPAAQTSEAPGPLDWLRNRSKPAPGADMPVVEITDEAPLSPRNPARPAMSPLSNLAEPVLDPRPPGRSERASEARPASRSDQVARAAPVERERPKEHGFDVAWPDAKREPAAWETRERDAKPEFKIEPLPPAREDHDRGVREEHDKRPREEYDSRGDTPLGLSADRSPAILKSGVIDGMAYTLYADGSIEAELPQGTMRFASVDALRAHLEKNG